MDTSSLCGLKKTQCASHWVFTAGGVIMWTYTTLLDILPLLKQAWPRTDCWSSNHNFSRPGFPSEQQNLSSVHLVLQMNQAKAGCACQH